MKRTQKQVVKSKLREDGEITNLWCIQNNIWRLGAIIHEIRKEDGWDIDGDFVEGSKNFCYTLKDAPKRIVRMEIDPITRIAKPIMGI